MMTDFKERFGEYLKKKKKVSENTLNSYLRDIEQFLEYLDGRKISAKDVSATKSVNTYSVSNREDVRNPASTVCFQAYDVFTAL